MKRAFNTCFTKFWALLPKDLDTRADLCLVFTLPVVLIKAIRKIIFPRKSTAGIDAGAEAYCAQMQQTLPAGEIPAGVGDKEIAIRYSGGDDSTLTAATVATHFRKVHLLTFSSNSRLRLFGFINSDPDNALVNVRNLSNRFGADKFKHTVINSGKLRNIIYFRDFTPACGDDLFLRSCFCLPCALAMHIETIIYCLRNGIGFASDGSNIESGILPWQTQNPFNLREVAGFYKRFGIAYIVNPAYYVRESDAELNKLGVHKIAGSKTNYRHRRKTQQFCHLIQVQTVCRRFCCAHTSSPADSYAQAGMFSRYFKDMIPEYEKYIFSMTGTNAPRPFLSAG